MEYDFSSYPHWHGASRSMPASEQWVLSILGEGGGRPVIRVTYMQALQRATQGTLIAGQLYWITNYRTRFLDNIFPHTLDDITLLAREDIFVRAVSTTQFGHLAWSGQYPEDVVYYNFEDGIITRPDRGGIQNILRMQAGTWWVFDRTTGEMHNTGISAPDGTHSGHLGNHVGDWYGVYWLPPNVAAGLPARIGIWVKSPSAPAATFPRYETHYYLDEWMSRPGLITRRTLPKQNIDIAWDWRNIIWNVRVPGTGVDGVPAQYVGRYTLSANSHPSPSFRPPSMVAPIGVGNSPDWSTTVAPVAKSTHLLRDIVLSNCWGTVLHFHPNDSDPGQNHSHSINFENWAFRNQVSHSNVIKIGVQSCDNIITRCHDVGIGAEASHNTIYESNNVKLDGNACHNRIHHSIGATIGARSHDNIFEFSESSQIANSSNMNRIINSPGSVIGPTSNNNRITGSPATNIGPGVTDATITGSPNTDVKTGSRHVTITGSPRVAIGTGVHNATVTNSADSIIEAGARLNQILSSPGTIIPANCYHTFIQASCDIVLAPGLRQTNISSCARINIQQGGFLNGLGTCSEVELGHNSRHNAVEHANSITFGKSVTGCRVAASNTIKIGDNCLLLRISHSNSIEVGPRTHGGMLHGRLSSTMPTFEVPDWATSYDIIRCENIKIDSKGRLGRLINSTFGEIGGDTTGFIIIGATRFKIGPDCHGINVNGVEDLFIKGSCSDVTIDNSADINLGSKCVRSTISRSNNINLGFDNSNMTIVGVSDLRTAKQIGRTEVRNANDVEISEDSFANSISRVSAVKIGRTCSRNIISASGEITIGPHSTANFITSSHGVTTGQHFHRNTVQQSRYISIGNDCADNVIFHCDSVSFGNNCTGITTPWPKISPNPNLNITEVNAILGVGDDSRLLIVKLTGLSNPPGTGTYVRLDGVDLIEINMNDGLSFSTDSFWYLPRINTMVNVLGAHTPGSGAITWNTFTAGDSVVVTEDAGAFIVSGITESWNGVDLAFNFGGNHLVTTGATDWEIGTRIVVEGAVENVVDWIDLDEIDEDFDWDEFDWESFGRPVRMVLQETDDPWIEFAAVENITPENPRFSFEFEVTAANIGVLQNNNLRIRPGGPEQRITSFSISSLVRTNHNIVENTDSGVGTLEVYVPDHIAATPSKPIVAEDYGYRNTAIIESNFSWGENVIHGRVLCSNTGNPVVHARVDLINTQNGTRYGAYTDREGGFAQWVENGTHHLVITRSDYNAFVSPTPITIDGDSYEQPVVTLTPGVENSRVIITTLLNAPDQSEGTVTIEGTVTTWDNGTSTEEEIVDEFNSFGNHSHWITRSDQNNPLGGVGLVRVVIPGFQSTTRATHSQSFWENVLVLNINLVAMVALPQLINPTPLFSAIGGFESASQTVTLWNRGAMPLVLPATVSAAGWNIELLGSWGTSLAQNQSRQIRLTLQNPTSHASQIVLNFGNTDPVVASAVIEPRVVVSDIPAGMIIGRVNVPAGHPASIRLMGSTGILRSAQTDSNGVYKFEELPPGDYAVIFQRIGWNAQIRHVILESGASEGVALSVDNFTMGQEDRILLVRRDTRVSGVGFTARLGTIPLIPLVDDPHNVFWYLVRSRRHGIAGGVGLLTVESPDIDALDWDWITTQRITQSHYGGLGGIATQFTMPRMATQPTTGVVRGRVTSVSGAPINQAAISLVGTSFEAQFFTHSNTHGEFRIPSVPNGKYVLGFSAEGYTAQTSNPFELRNFGDFTFNGLTNTHFGDGVSDIVRNIGAQGDIDDYAAVPDTVWGNPEVRKDIVIDYNGHISCKYILDGETVITILK